jgi:hypothetical protein
MFKERVQTKPARAARKRQIPASFAAATAAVCRAASGIWGILSRRNRQRNLAPDKRISDETVDFDKKGIPISIASQVPALGERKRVPAEIGQALPRGRMHREILTICCSCKKIRTGKSSWQAIENYIREHAAVDFSHGLCPDCSKKLYGDDGKEAGEREGEGEVAEKKSAKHMTDVVQ